MAPPRSEWGSQAQWAITACLLAAALAGHDRALPAAIALCVLSLCWYGLRLRSLRPYRMQVRLGVLSLLGVAALPGMNALLWLPLCGMSAQLLVGYCPMARIVDLLPWNRSEALSRSFVWRVLTRPPGREGVFSGLLHAGGGTGAPCPD